MTTCMVTLTPLPSSTALIEATARAMRSAARDAATDAAQAAEQGGGDEDGGTGAARHFVFVLSDANFRRCRLTLTLTLTQP